jgi:YVTN family beta-propeller protein
MRKRNLNYIITLFILVGAILTSCTKEDENTPIIIDSDNRIFVTNEGPFQNGSGSLTVFYRNSLEVYNNIFAGVNGFKLGNLVQSINVHNDKVYIVVNNAGRIEIANKNDLVSQGAIEGINLPRYFLAVNDQTAYVSSWDNKVYIVDLNTNSVSAEIITATGPEKMIKVGDEVWVLNQGGFSYDSTITIINSADHNVIKNLVVGDKPSGIVIDKDGYVWVMCSGNGWNGFPGADDSRGKLVCIDPVDYTIINTHVFPYTDKHPEKLVIDNKGENMFYNYPGGLFTQNIYEETLEVDPLYAHESMFYALGFDPVSSTVFVSDPLDFIQTGIVYRIDPYTGEELSVFEAGIIPGEFYFNE